MVDRCPSAVDNEGMPSDERINVRIDSGDRQTLQSIADRLATRLGKRITVSDVVRLAIDDYIRRNG